MLQLCTLCIKNIKKQIIIWWKKTNLLYGAGLLDTLYICMPAVNLLNIAKPEWNESFQFCTNKTCHMYVQPNNLIFI